MPIKPFKLERFGEYDKSVRVTGPKELRFDVDTDDCDKRCVVRELRKAIRILNEHWDTSDDTSY